MAQFHWFLWLRSIPLYICTSSLPTHPSVGRVCFPILAIVNLWGPAMITVGALARGSDLWHAACVIWLWLLPTPSWRGWSLPWLSMRPAWNCRSAPVAGVGLANWKLQPQLLCMCWCVALVPFNWLQGPAETVADMVVCGAGPLKKEALQTGPCFCQSHPWV